MRKPELRFVKGVNEGPIFPNLVSPILLPSNHFKTYPRHGEGCVRVHDSAIVGIEYLQGGVKRSFEARLFDVPKVDLRACDPKRYL